MKNRGETHCMYLKDDPECKPWHLNWTIHPRHVPLANTFCDYRNIFEVLYDNTNYTCHHRDCTSELRAYEFSTEGIWCLKWYLWDPLLIHESYLNCKKKKKNWKLITKKSINFLKINKSHLPFQFSSLSLYNFIHQFKKSQGASALRL